MQVDTRDLVSPLHPLYVINVSIYSATQVTSQCAARYIPSSTSSLRTDPLRMHVKQGVTADSRREKGQYQVKAYF